ncbi:MAG: divalent metal cation transporter [Chitinophagia bacterium]|jgi:Mn2+/Fe2+ NRAMP family transporter|nr:divalent metal cation transporter [Chitinophagia bacterium]NCA29394.1 divalent metal cation transporter [Chitinophagia bacterium]NDD15609.1 divalent metal cation transporter [Chitinophagia bacterium]
MTGLGLGAAFLMANSSIGPGFLTQTSFYTEKLLTSFGFVILISIILDFGAQINIWRAITLSGMRAQEIANEVFPGLGHLLSFLVILGGFAFNIGNIAGCGLALNILTGISFAKGAIISGVVAIIIFWIQEIGKMLDQLTKILGIIKIGLTLIIVYAAHPPILEAVHHSFIPEKISLLAIVTIVGGTVGGYITFSGAHRLIDAGISGTEHIKFVTKSASRGILISSFMRYILFLAAVGIVSQGIHLDKNNPAATIFESAAGRWGLFVFGIVLWSAAISSVIGASYTSYSFIKNIKIKLLQNERHVISVFIILSTSLFVFLGKPKELLLMAGLVNGFILPFALTIMLIAGRKLPILKQFKYPLWVELMGWMVVVLMGSMSIFALIEQLNK